MRINLSTRDNMYSRRLSGDSLKVYNAIVDSLSNGDLHVSCSVSNFDEINNNFNMIVSAVCVGNPELFYMKQSFSPTFSDGNFNLIMESIYDVSTLDEKYKALMDEVDRISEIIARILDKKDQLYRLNEYLSIRVRTIQENDFRYGSPYGALISCVARCEGFAKAAKLILNKLGFDNEIIIGKATYNGQTVDHAWNSVNYEGKNYYFDFTWNAGYSLEQTIAIPLYTFLDKETMLINHEPQLTLGKDNDDSLLFWKQHKGELKYLSDLDDIDIVRYKNHSFGIAKMPFCLNDYEKQYDLINWVGQAFGYSIMALTTTCAYAEGIDCAVIYFMN